MNRKHYTIVSLVAVIAAMTGLVSYSVTLYRLFCQATGAGGTTRVAEERSAIVGERVITVRFDGHVNPSLPWKFAPSQHELKVQLGENALAFYEASNMAARDTVGQATYNVLPEKAAPYFYKIQCFCFSEQALKPGQTVEMPVSFYVDPKLAEDRNLAEVDTITLSYTFFRADSPRQLSERK